MVGVLCFQFFGDALWVSIVAVMLTMVFMVATRSIHPPAGANPLIMVHHQASFSALLKPVGLGVLTLFLVALFWSPIRPSKRYPMNGGENEKSRLAFPSCNGTMLHLL